MASFPLRIEDLPPPPPDRTGFPWTEGTRALPDALPGGKAYPKISVVTPSYQQGQYLEETIRSVLLQSYPNLEYLVIDGGSQDNSKAVIEKYAPFLSFWTSERDRGQANAVNKGFARSTGEIMGWLNSDDILYPGALYWIARTLAEAPDAQLVTGFRKVIDKESHVMSNWVRDIPTNYYMRHYCCIAQETTYWRRSVWEQLGPLDESFHFALDYEYWLRAIHNGYSFHLIPHFIGYFREYVENKSGSWLDVYYHDMGVIYRRYAMGKDEADVHAKLGQRWARRYGLYLTLSRQSWTAYPRLVQLAWRLLEMPLLADAILSGWMLHNTYGELRRTHHQSRLTALKTTVAQGMRQMAWRKPKSSSGEANDWGSVRTLPNQAEVDERALNALPPDTLAFGKNWYATEVYQGETFRWCSDLGEIYVLNASGTQTNLRLIVAPAIPAAENRLDLLDDHGDVLTSAAGDAPRFELEIALPRAEGARVRYKLKWSGVTGGETQHEGRRLAFRVLAMGWRDAAALLAATLAAYQRSVDAMLARQVIDDVPAIGTLAAGMRRWRNAAQVMTQELALWRELQSNMALVYHEYPPDTRTARASLCFVIDCSTHLLNNIGDMAIYTVLLRRIRARYPDARIRMITDDPQGVAKLDAEVTPLAPGSRQLEASETWETSIKEADAVFLSGGGYFTDAFAPHALSMLTTLQEGMAHGAATFIVGCGFEPTSDAALTVAADATLPRVDFIACREDTISPQVLARHGVDATRIAVTGDDALELAYEARPETLGQAIGVNLRSAVYNPVDDAQIEIIRSVLSAACDTLGTALVPVPIAILDPWDSREIKKLMRDGDGGAAINTPDLLFEQIRQCRVIVTGSYHAGVFGLAMGMPVIALTRSLHYQRKMQGLVAMYARPGLYENAVFGLDDPEFGGKLSEALQRLWANANDARPALLETTERLVRAGQSAYERIFERIDEICAQRAGRERTTRIV